MEPACHEIELFDICESLNYFEDGDIEHGPNILHGAILAVVERMCDLHGVDWFGCRREDWRELAMISKPQYDKVCKGMIASGKLVRQREMEFGSGIPVLYHARPGKKVKPLSDARDNSYTLPRGEY